MSLIKINKEAYKYNLYQISKKTDGFERLICVLKDNAYGHGAKMLAPIAKDLGILFAAVKNEKEAIEIEEFFENILILSHIPNQNEHSRFIYALNDISQIKQYKQNTRIHLKIDTGMNRNGVCVEYLEYAINLIQNNGLKLEGVFTHFASADEMDVKFFTQKDNFQKAKDIAKKYSLNLLFHSYNSSALFQTDIPKDEYCRVGLAQFGYGSETLKKVLSLYAHKISQRVLKKGQSVGYGGVFQAENDLEIATYDLGYADGLFRYDGKGKLILGNGKYMLGKMSMDSFCCENTGDEICVFNDANVWANFFHTIDYEILAKLHRDIPRILV